MNPLQTYKRVQVIAALVEGNSINATTRITGVSKHTVLNLLHDLGNTAQAFIQDLAERVTNRFQLTTDGHKAYADAVEDAFGADIDYAMLVKLYGAPSSNMSAESRYSPATCIGCRTGILSGNPDPKHISTSFVERQYLTMRMGFGVLRGSRMASARRLRITATLSHCISCTTTSVAFISHCALPPRWKLV